MKELSLKMKNRKLTFSWLIMNKINSSEIELKYMYVPYKNCKQGLHVDVLNSSLDLYLLF